MKKLKKWSILLGVIFALSFMGCETKNPENEGENQPQGLGEVIKYDISGLLSYSVKVTKSYQAEKNDVAGNALIVPEETISLSYNKVQKGENTYSVYKFEKLECGTALDGKNGDEAMKLDPLCDTIYTVIAVGEDFYYEKNTKEYADSTDEITYPGIEHTYTDGKATGEELEFIQNFLATYAPTALTLDGFATAQNVAKKDFAQTKEKLGQDTLNKYSLTNTVGSYGVFTDGNGLLVKAYGEKSVHASTTEKYYFYEYVFSNSYGVILQTLPSIDGVIA